MKKRVLSLLAFLFFIVAACGVPPSKPLDLSVVEAGMSKQYISQILRPPDRVVGTRIFSDIFVEVWEYDRYSRLSQRTKESEGVYWLYFFNGTLEKWGHPDSGSWVREAEKIIKLRYQ